MNCSLGYCGFCKINHTHKLQSYIFFIKREIKNFAILASVILPTFYITKNLIVYFSCLFFFFFWEGLFFIFCLFICLGVLFVVFVCFLKILVTLAYWRSCWCLYKTSAPTLKSLKHLASFYPSLHVIHIFSGCNTEKKPKC